MSEGFLGKLEASARKNKSILCLGIDPVLSRIPKEHRRGKAGKSITSYFLPLISASKRQISAIKPNYAFFAQYGFEGLRALEEIISAGRKAGLPVILDAKRGDIGASSEAYAREAFDFWKADAVTISPYMGSDSISPFLEYCKRGKGIYILCRTSNEGAADFQLPNWLYITVAKKIIEWNGDGGERREPVRGGQKGAAPGRGSSMGVGAVVGATSPAELSELARLFANSGKRIPLLIPGVGTQGGSASEVSKILSHQYGTGMLLHRINASSSISYACEAKKGDPLELALAEIERLNSEIGV